MNVDDFAEFVNTTVFGIVQTYRRRKFYYDYDNEVCNTNQRNDVHLKAKACADGESVCGPIRTVLLGCCGIKGTNVK